MGSNRAKGVPRKEIRGRAERLGLLTRSAARLRNAFMLKLSGGKLKNHKYTTTSDFNSSACVCVVYTAAVLP